MKRKKIIFIVAGIVSIPAWLWGAWVVTPKKKMVVAIVDKTDDGDERRPHTALTWILNNEKYSKTRKKLYTLDTDYFGFFPKQKPQARIKGLENLSNAQLEQLSSDCDIAYYVDTYGAYNKTSSENSFETNKGGGFIYGGMSQRDIDFLIKAKSKHKLIIAENNTLQSPTSLKVRKQFESTFGFKWSGWTARYFESFDPKVNKELPAWLVNNYMVKNSADWTFKGGGLAFVHEAGDVVILEDKKDLHNPVPYISVTNKYKESFDELPTSTKFPFWFDIVIPDGAINQVAANFDIDYTLQGKQKLLANKIPLSIPAIISHNASDYQFYYFSGNFCSTNTIDISSSYFRGVSLFQSVLYNEDETLEQTSFFWKFYRPLMTSILGNYYDKLKR